MSREFQYPHTVPLSVANQISGHEFQTPVEIHPKSNFVDSEQVPTTQERYESFMRQGDSLLTTAVYTENELSDSAIAGALYKQAYEYYTLAFDNSVEGEEDFALCWKLADCASRIADWRGLPHAQSLHRQTQLIKKSKELYKLGWNQIYKSHAATETEVRRALFGPEINSDLGHIPADVAKVIAAAACVEVGIAWVDDSPAEALEIARTAAIDLEGAVSEPVQAALNEQAVVSLQEYRSHAKWLPKKAPDHPDLAGTILLDLSQAA